ncbi:MAG: MFS transporter [Waddliaceae bacterium]|nr:MFS transporter [Waddliaceae bacterium]
MKSLLPSRIPSFGYLNIAQFLGAMNDNIFKLLIGYLLIELEGVDASQRILAIAGGIFVIPFLLFSSLGGSFADRYSKRNVIIWVKGLELVVMLSGVLTVWYESKEGCFGVLFLMATQSALFGPSKYGIVPEIVESERLSRANGLLSSLTYLAIIIGTFLASFMVDITGGDYILAASFCAVIAALGFIASFGIEYTPPAGSCEAINPVVIRQIYHNIQEAKKTPSLLTAMLGSAFFLFIGAFLQLNIIPFAIQSLHLTSTQGGYLFLLTSLGIGTGSVISGKLSGKYIELGLVPLGACGIVFGLLGMDYYSESLPMIVFLVTFTGVLAGIYLIPLDTYIQVASPARSRGQMLASTNFLGFNGVLLASAFVYVLAEVFTVKADKGFTVMAIIVFAMLIFMFWSLSRYTIRFFGMVLSRFFFRISLSGSESIPRDIPAVLFCRHSSWSDSILLMGTQRRCLSFIKDYGDHSPDWKTYFYRLLRIIPAPKHMHLYEDPESLKLIKENLEKEISVCIYLNHLPEDNDIEKLKICLHELIGDQYPMLSVMIQKHPKADPERVWEKPMSKLRIPAFVSFGPLTS